MATDKPADDVELDGTPFAHPAYWRGSDQAVASLCQLINQILDGRDNGHGVANEPWESTRRRLLSLANPKTPEPKDHNNRLSISFRDPRGTSYIFGADLGTHSEVVATLCIDGIEIGVSPDTCYIDNNGNYSYVFPVSSSWFCNLSDEALTAIRDQFIAEKKRIQTRAAIERERRVAARRDLKNKADAMNSAHL
jgi:hypothetical protein